MITADLISYIRKQQENNISRDLILVKLATAGWHIEDINEGFEKVEEIKNRENKLYPPKNIEENLKDEEDAYRSASLADRYREPIDLDAEPLAKKEIPTAIKKKEIIDSKNEEVVTISDPVSPSQDFNIQNLIDKQSPAIDAQKDGGSFVVNEESQLNTMSPDATDETKTVFDLSEISSEINNFVPILDSNMNVVKPEIEDKKILIEPVLESIPEEIKAKETPLSVNNIDLNANKELNIEKIEIQNSTIENTVAPLVEPILTANEIVAPKDINKVWLPKNIPVKEIQAPEEEENDIIIQNPELPAMTLSSEIEKEEEFKSYKLETLPKIAPMATYPKDVLTALSQLEKEKANAPVKKLLNKNLVKWIVIVLVIILIGGVFAWAVVTNKINLKNINIPFINKDPRSLILNNSKILASLDSYKTETVLEITTPSFANISAGLLTGEAVSSLDKDNLILNSTATVNQKDGMLTSDNIVVVKGSIFQEIVDARIHNDGQYLYLNFPDLSNVLKEPAPLFGSVKISEQEFYVVPSLFGPKTEKALNKINVYKLLSNGISSYVDQEALGNYDDIIKKVQIVKRGEESVKGVQTYHYNINPDKELFKNLLIKTVERFTNGLNEVDKENANLLISSASISSFDVWVGKGDNTIYQYNIILEIPMTKILGFEDKSIGNDTMSISLKATYFDFNISEDILIPNDYTGIEEFVKKTNIENTKNKVKEFVTLANNLQKVEKKFGAKSNGKGSCMSPVSGSLFSPVGHLKTAILPVSEISSFLNYVLGLTKGMGSCYSTTTDWSFAIPLVDNYETVATSEAYDTFYCIDSKGSDIEISALPSGVTCEQKTVEKPQS